MPLHRSVHVGSLPVVADRSSLVRGAYVPDESTTGPTVSSWTNQEANASGFILMTTANEDCVEKTHWGDVRHQATGIHHHDCRIAGPDPLLMYNGTYGSTGAGQLVRAYGGSTYKHWRGDNVLIDPTLWYTERDRTPMTDATWVTLDGIEGGDMHLRWSRIQNVVDGLHFMHQDNPTDAGTAAGYEEDDFVSPAGQRFAILDRCLLQKCAFVQGDVYGARPNAQADNRPHGDGVQLIQGKNLWVTGTKIGGVRDSAGYTLWPNDGSVGNSGSDFYNAAIMGKLEGTYTSGDVQWLDNLLFDRCFLAGGIYTVNLYAGSGNTLTGLTIKDTFIAERKYGDGLGRDEFGVATSLNGGYGYYRTGDLDSTWSNVRVLETNALIPAGNTQT